MLGRNRLWLWVTISLVLVLVITWIARKDEGGNMKSTTPADYAANREIEIVRGFLRADSKHHLVPLPTGLDPKNVLTVVRSKLINSRSIQELRKLSELTIFYNQKDLAQNFLTFLQENEKLNGNLDLSFVCVITLAWIAEEEQLLQTQTHFQKLLHKAEFPENRTRVLQTCDAFSSKEAAAQVKAWLNEQANAINRKIDEFRRQSTLENIGSLEEKRDWINRFIRNEIQDIEDLIRQRAAMEAAEESGTKLSQFAKLYLNDIVEQSYWAAMKLIREADKSEQTRQVIASEFLKLSQTYVIDDKQFEQMEAQYDEDDEAQYEDAELAELHKAVLNRARCLRAAEFFGATLDTGKSTWLSKQEDVGTDPLALRPNWKYPGFAEE